MFQYFIIIHSTVSNQNMKEEYGLFVWPSSVILAEYVWQQKTRFCGANVVEVSEVAAIIITVHPVS